MKKIVAIVFTLVIIISSIPFALADGSLKINGINLPMISGDGQHLSLQEIDGVLYIPVEPFLNALGLDYTIDEGSVSVTFVAPENTNTDEYATLLPEEAYFVDLVLDKASSFKNPSTITVKSLIYVGGDITESKVYITGISAQNGFGGYTTQYYMIMDDGSIAMWFETTAEKVAEFYEIADGIEQPAFDYGRINRAIKQKVSELGY